MKKLYFFFNVIFLIFLSTSNIYGNVEVDFAYFRKLHPEYDTGTVHLFLKNNGLEPRSVKNIRINDCLLNKTLPDNMALWKQIIPKNIAPQKTSNISVKLRANTKRLIKIEVELDDGQKIKWVLRPFSPPLRITFVGFNDDLKKMYVYIENSSSEKINIDDIFMDDVSITSQLNNNIKSIKGMDKNCLVFDLKKPLLHGKRIFLKLNSKEEVLFETHTRVYSNFPVQSFWDRAFMGKYGFDDYLLFMEDTDDIKSDKRKLYFLHRDPVCEDAGTIMGDTANIVIKRANKKREIDKKHLTCIYMCACNKPMSYFAYGETADVIMVNPFEVAEYAKKPYDDGYFTHIARLSAQPRVLYTFPEAFQKTDKKSRFPTNEEMEKIVAYEIANGSKGLIYFNRKSKKDFYKGFGENKKLLKTISKINNTLTPLKEYLKISDVYKKPLIKSNNDYDAFSLLCGDKGIIIVLIAKKNKVRKDKISIELPIPSWLKVNECLSITIKGTKKLKFMIEKRLLQTSVTNNSSTCYILLKQ